MEANLIWWPIPGGRGIREARGRCMICKDSVPWSSLYVYARLEFGDAIMVCEWCQKAYSQWFDSQVAAGRYR